MTDPRPTRPVDDFEWLPSRLSELGRDPEHLKPTRIEIDLPGGRQVSALRWGDEPARALYLHGGGQNAHTWDLVVALVGEPALAIDLPGHGHSHWRDDKDYRPTTNAQTVAEALDALNVRPEVVIGMSLGGLTTFALSAARPELTKDLVIVDILPGVENAAKLSRKEMGAVALVSGPREFDTLEAMERETIAAAGPNRSAESLRRGVWHNAVQLPGGRWRWRYDDLRARVPQDTSHLWQAVAESTSPLTLVKGGASPFVSAEALERLRHERPDAQIVVVPDVGHAVQSENAEALAQLVRERFELIGVQSPK